MNAARRALLATLIVAFVVFLALAWSYAAGCDMPGSCT